MKNSGYSTHFFKHVFKISFDLEHSEIIYEFFCAVQMVDRRRKSNFLISLASGLASDDSCSPTQKRRHCGHPIANVHANTNADRRSPTQTPTLWPPDRRYRSPTTIFIMHADSIADVVAIALLLIKYSPFTLKSPLYLSNLCFTLQPPTYI